MAAEKDTRAVPATPVANAGYGYASAFAKRCLCHRLGTCYAELDAVLGGLASALLETDVHADPALDGIVRELRLGRENLAHAIELAAQRL